MKKVLLTVSLAATILSGCAITTEGSLLEPLAEKPDTVCIIYNPDVGIKQAHAIFRKAFKDHGINAVVCREKSECKSQWYMTYDLSRSWDMATYLSSGHLELYKGDALVSTSDFSGGWGFNFGKYGRTQQKLEGMIDALLGEVGYY